MSVTAPPTEKAADYTETLTVLLVEADPVHVEATKLLAEESQLRVEWMVAGSLAEAKAILGVVVPACILLDLELPDSVGLATLDEVRAAAPSVALVVVTDEDLGVAAIAGGAQDSLIRGELDAARLSRSIRYAVERQHLQVTADAAHRRATDTLVLLDRSEWAAPIGIGVLDLELHFRRVNPILSDILAWASPAIEQAARDAASKQQPVSETNLASPSGTPWLVTCYPVWVDGDQVGVGVLALSPPV